MWSACVCVCVCSYIGPLTVNGQRAPKLFLGLHQRALRRVVYAPVSEFLAVADCPPAEERLR